MWHVPFLDLHGGRVMGHMGNVACAPSRSTWGRVVGHMGNGAHEHKGNDDGGTWVMGNRGDGAHGKWGT